MPTAGKRVGLAAISQEDMMADIFAVLGHDHEEAKRMLTELETGPTVATGTNGHQRAAQEDGRGSRDRGRRQRQPRRSLPNGEQLADRATGLKQDGKVVWPGLRIPLAETETEAEDLGTSVPGS
jgi:hypothetical protein